MSTKVVKSYEHGEIRIQMSEYRNGLIEDMYVVEAYRKDAKVAYLANRSHDLISSTFDQLVKDLGEPSN